MAGSSILLRLSVSAACAVAAVGLGLAPAASAPEPGPQAADEFPGARSVEPGHVEVQRRADQVRPGPSAAFGDKGQMYADGCQLGAGETKPTACIYGDRSSDTTVLLVGDSTAMHHFPALEPIARAQEWRLVGMTKAGCSLALYPRQDDCAEWQRNMFDWIADKRPDMVITAGRPTSDRWSHSIVEDGWVKGLRRIKRTGAKVVLMAAGPEPSREIPHCVAQHMERLRRCAMPVDEALGYAHNDVRGARQVPGVVVVNERRLLCNSTVCPTVIGNVLVYRTTFHFTATWMETMTEHVDRMLPDP